MLNTTKIFHFAMEGNEGLVKVDAEKLEKQKLELSRMRSEWDVRSRN